MKRMADLSGQKFGRLTVLRNVREGGETRLHCRCDCGKETTPAAYNVKNGNTTSCGCALEESRAARAAELGRRTGPLNKTHGMTESRTYVSWQEARKRCHLPTSTGYKRYGGRGITVCEKWRDSFEAFLADMGECPPGLTLERLDNAKGYEPGNCEWATRERQAQHRGWNKANPEIVRAIRDRAAAGAAIADLAAEYGMCNSNTRLIVARQTWKNVE